MIIPKKFKFSVTVPVFSILMHMLLRILHFMHLSNMLPNIIFPDSPITAKRTIKRLRRRMHLNMLVKIHRIEKHFITGMTRILSGSIVMMIDVMI